VLSMLTLVCHVQKVMPHSPGLSGSPMSFS
jgi:hypothetical protein